jgi:hypothetical protein
VPFEMLLMPCGDHQYPWGYDEYPSDISPSKYTKPAKFKKKKKKQTKIQKKQQQLQSKNELSFPSSIASPQHLSWIL